MKIALIGYGKMGKAIEEIAEEKGDEIVLKITSSNQAKFTNQNLQQADVAIEFTNAECAVGNIKKCLDANVPVICGTTGWLNEKENIEQYCKEKNGAFLYASNFSVGVNIFFELNTQLATMMEKQNSYNVQIEEIHHTQKKDAPSGTAITLAEQILSSIQRKKTWTNKPATNNDELFIESKRIDAVPGTHIVTYSSEIDGIEIKHTAHNRKGFAAGALLAAKFLYNKKGIFTMQDVLGL